MISIIILTYNSNFEKILMTIESILQQSYSDYEIIISDDGSSIDNLVHVEAYFQTIGFKRYILNRLVKNVGTVKSLISACKVASGKYIKPIGAGDLLFGEQTLGDMASFMEENQSLFAFGCMKSYQLDDMDNVRFSTFSAPRNLRPYKNNNQKLIKKNIVIAADWISGSTLFYNKEYILPKMEEISKYVTYCEDLVQLLVVLESARVDFFPRHVLWYEFGDGVSTSSENALSVRLKRDHIHLWEYINDSYSEDSMLKSRLIIEQLCNRIRFGLIRKVMKRLMYLFMGCYSCPLNKIFAFDGDGVDGFLSEANSSAFLRKIRNIQRPNI